MKKNTSKKANSQKQTSPSPKKALAKNKASSKKACPISHISWLFQDIYTIHIIKNLLENKKVRFTELKSEIKDLCDATLSKNLKTLEKEDMISKESLNTFPRSIEYTLTKKGKDFSKVFKQLEAFSKKY